MEHFFKNLPTYLQWLLSLSLSVFLSALIGMERKKAHRPAGIRTHILVGVGACLVMVTGQYIQFKGGSLDTTRMAAQVVSGIGFLGAGTIIKSGKKISGLTTAATLWLVACIGLACGAGFYWGALIAGLFAYLTLLLLKRMEKLLVGRDTIHLQIPGDSPSLSNTMDILRHLHCEIQNISTEQDDAGRNIILETIVTQQKKTTLISSLITLPDVTIDTHEDE